MTMDRQTLCKAIGSYRATFATDQEQNVAKDFINLLKSEDCFQRDHLPGHITGSAWILNKDLTKSVLIFHKNLARWLQLGGHADGDENVLRVALREAEEETGLKNFAVIDPRIFDLDIHPIPARKGLAAHLHYDIRFAIYADEHEPLFISDESTGLKWVDLNSVDGLTNGNKSMVRLVEKTRFLKESGPSHFAGIVT